MIDLRIQLNVFTLQADIFKSLFLQQLNPGNKGLLELVGYLQGLNIYILKEKTLYPMPQIFLVEK